MTSQTQDATPTCEDHGYMIPVNRDLALLDEDGVVQAVVEWVSREGEPLRAVIYALGEDELALVPLLDGDVHVGNWAREMTELGRLVPFYGDVVMRAPGLLRVDAGKPFGNASYYIYTGDELGRGPRLMPRGVYVHYTWDEGDEPNAPLLTNYDDVLALTKRPDRLDVSTVPQAVVGGTTDSEAGQNEWGDVQQRLVVWDLYAIQADIRARRARSS